MTKPLLLTTAFLCTVLTLCWSVHEPPQSSCSPMGAGDEQGRQALKLWNEERLRDPATGRIPENIRSKELAFASTLPHRAVAKSLDWVRQGPVNRGGRTRAFRADATDPNVLLAGAATGGIWRTTNMGAEWVRTSAPMDIQNTSCLAQDLRTGHTQTWYCGTGENYGVVSGTSFEALLPGDGIFKSTDGGSTWSLLPATVSNTPQVFDVKGAFKHVNSIVVDPSRMDSDIVVAAIFDGLVRSNDGGISWSPVLGLDVGTTATSLYTDVRVTPNGVFYAAIGAGTSYRGIYRSTDGLQWTNISVGQVPQTMERTVIGIDPSNQDRVWFFMESPSAGLNGHSLFKYSYLSGDGSGTGGLWSNRSANLPDQDCLGYFTFNFGIISTQTSYDMCIAVHPTDSNTVFIGGTNVYRSRDGWSAQNTYDWIGGYRCNADDPKDYVYPNHHPDQHWLEFAPDDASRLYSTNDGGVHVTLDPLADSVQWVMLNDRYVTSQFYTVHIEEGAATSPYILGGTQDNGCWMSTSTDPNAPWSYVHQDDGAYSAIPQGRAFILTSSQSGRIYKKSITDAGVVTGFERIDPEGATGQYNFINQFVLDPVSNNKLYVCAATKLWRNNDVAGIPVSNNFYNKINTNWEQITEVTGSQRLCALDISLADPDVLWYGTTNGRVFRVDSLDTNPDRALLDSDEFPTGAYVSCVAPNDFDANEWLVTFCNYGVRSVFHTTDGGLTFTSVSGNIEENADGSGNGPAVYWATIYPTWNNEANRYFIGTSTGLYSTALLNGDATVWEQEGADLIGNVPVNMMTSRGSDGLIAVGTHGLGVFTSHLPAAAVGQTETPEDAFAAGQAWPNPAQSAVNFPVYMPNAGVVHMRVLDLAGQLVREQALTIPAGNSTGTWDLRSSSGAHVSQGTYLITLHSGKTLRTMRVIIP